MMTMNKKGITQSSSLKCPVVKVYRVELTRKILHDNHQRSPITTTSQSNYIYSSAGFPLPPAPQANLISPMMNKLDELINSMTDIKKKLLNLEEKHDRLEQFMLLKQQNDEIVSENLDLLFKKQDDLKKDVMQHGLLIQRHAVAQQGGGK
ncbi:hypothetical protein I4U23_010783 [Adineta vaga]|nr:hypothetical protein I4U23_010783 [Adineta vaga]